MIAGNQTVIMVPMDVDNDGRLDLVIQKCLWNQSVSPYPICELSAIYNNLIFDSFFVKAVLLAQIEPSTDNIEQKNFGSAISGATFRYVVTTLEDDKYVRVAS